MYFICSVGIRPQVSHPCKARTGITALLHFRLYVVRMLLGHRQSLNYLYGNKHSHIL
jgi:hypothetical protein